MIEKLKVTKVYISTENKDKKPFLTTGGKPYSKIGIQTVKYGVKWLSGFVWDSRDKIAQIKEGDEILAVVEENGQWTNFKLATKTDVLEGKVNELHDRISIVEGGMRDIFEGKKPYPARTPGPDEGHSMEGLEEEKISPEDIPF